MAQFGSDSHSAEAAARAYKRKVIVISIILTVAVVVGGWLLFDNFYRGSGQAQANPQAPELTEEQEKLQKEGEQRIERMGFYKSVIDRDFPGWTIKGDDLDDLTLLTLENDIAVNVHLEKENRYRVVSLRLHKFRPLDKPAEKEDEYWIAYRPTALQLGRLELKEELRKAYEDGQKNPPEYEPPDF